MGIISRGSARSASQTRHGHLEDEGWESECTVSPLCNEFQFTLCVKIIQQPSLCQLCPRPGLGGVDYPGTRWASSLESGLRLTNRHSSQQSDGRWHRGAEPDERRPTIG